MAQATATKTNPTPTPTKGKKKSKTVSALLGAVKGLKAQLEQLGEPRYKSAADKTVITPSKIFATAKDKGEETRHGFKSFSEFCGAVKQAGTPNGERDNRLNLKAISGMSDTVASDGGFLVPPEFSNKIFERVYQNDLLSRTDRYTVSGNTISFPAIDEASRVDGSRFGGVRGYWLDEAQQITKSAPKFRRLTLTLRKLACLAYATEELLTDANVALDQYLSRLFAMEIEFQTGSAIIRGTGAGMPLGLLKSDCLISVSAETGQATKTVLTENIVKMWARMWGPSKANAVWLINQDVTPQLYTMTLGVGTGGVVTYMPPGGLSGQSYGTIFGRPVLEVEFCSTLGTAGDIILADLSQYITVSKGAVDSQMSMHLRFDYDELAYRVIFRMDGKPWWNTTLTPFQGTNTQSPFVALATR